MFAAEDDRPYHMGVGSRIAGVVQGYRPQVDWGGDAGSATIVVGGHNVKLATPGWRRRCLYLLLVALLVLSIVNLSLTLLVLKTTYFNVDGMGQLHVTVGGLAMEGTTRFMGTIRAAQVSSEKDKHLLIQGYHNLTVIATPEGNTPLSFLHLGVDDITASIQSLQVKSTSGQHLFYAHQRNGMAVGADRLTVTGSQGAILEGSLQTPLVFSRDVHELRLESATRSLTGKAAKEVNLEARDGDISVVSSNNLTLRSESGALRFDNPKIYLTGLKEAMTKKGGDGGGDGGGGVLATGAPAAETQLLPPPGRESPSTTPLPPSSSSSSSSSTVEVYQVCVCPNGRLFLMEAEVMCEFADNVCR